MKFFFDSLVFFISLADFIGYWFALEDHVRIEILLSNLVVVTLVLGNGELRFNASYRARDGPMSKAK